MSNTTTNANCPSLSSGIAYGVMNISGFLLNIILVVVIVKHTTTSLRPYAEVLITSCAIDIYSSFFQFLTQAVGLLTGKVRLFVEGAMG
jgi:hypothetical protein